jgi:hypothetical protein
MYGSLLGIWLHGTLRRRWDNIDMGLKDTRCEDKNYYSAFDVHFPCSCLLYRFISQPTNAQQFYNLPRCFGHNYSAIIRENASLRQQAAYDTLLNG